MVGSRELRFGAHERFGIGRMPISERKIEYVYSVIRFALTTALICSGTLASAQAGPPSESRVATIIFSGADNGDRTFPHRTILGKAKDADGKPVGGAMVYLRDVNNASLRVQLADDITSDLFLCRMTLRFGPNSKIARHRRSLLAPSSRRIKSPCLFASLPCPPRRT